MAWCGTRDGSTQRRLWTKVLIRDWAILYSILCSSSWALQGLLLPMIDITPLSTFSGNVSPCDEPMPLTCLPAGCQHRVLCDSTSACTVLRHPASYQKTLQGYIRAAYTATHFRHKSHKASHTYTDTRLTRSIKHQVVKFI